MKSIKVTIMGKQYPLKVEDHEEESMIRICRFVDERFQSYRHQLAKQPEATVMVLAALSIAEELFESRSSNKDLEKGEEKLMEKVNKSVDRLLAEIRE